MNMEPACVVCNKNAPHKCSACLSVAYCSAEHQRQHWKLHRKDCTNFRIVDDANLGKGMVATKDMKAGTLVLEEAPVVVSASWKGKIGNEPLTMACLTCGLGQKVGERVQKCTKCKWPICSVDCEQFWIHSENECRIFASKGFSYPPALPPDCLADLVKGIRACLLKRKDAQLYQQIFELSSEYSLPGDERSDLIVCVLMKLLASVVNLEFDRVELRKLLKIFWINCHTGSYLDKESQASTWQRKRSTEGLYLKSSRFNHSCIPNCSWQLSSRPEFKIRIFTSTAVKKGDPLTVTYWMEDSVSATRGRQESIRSKGRFTCRCARCLDPTELGTYMSGIVCSVCRGKGGRPGGYYLPQDPLDLSDTSTWKCNSCGDVKESAAILPAVEDIGRKITLMEMLYGGNPYDETLINLCKNVITTNSGRVLHPNHWVIQNAMRAVRNYLERNRRETMSAEWRRYYIEYSKHLLFNQDLLSPGLTYNRAMLHDGLAIALKLQCSGLHAQGNYDQMGKVMEECLTHLREALTYYKNGFPSIEGSDTLAAILERNIRCVLNDLAITRLKKLNLGEEFQASMEPSLKPYF